MPNLMPQRSAKHQPRDSFRSHIADCRSLPMTFLILMLFAWLIPIGPFTSQVGSQASRFNGTLQAAVSSPVNQITLAPGVEMGSFTVQRNEMTPAGTSSVIFYTISSEGSTPNSYLATRLKDMSFLFPMASKETYYVQGKRRNSFEIYVQVLKRLSADPLGITMIALFCKVNFKSAKDYVDYLSSKGLIECVTIDRRICYRITPLGMKFLDSAEGTLRYLNGRSLDT